jgi:hypothetical protein
MKIEELKINRDEAEAWHVEATTRYKALQDTQSKLHTRVENIAMRLK